MKLHFKNELFDGQLLRALSYVHAGGAEVGECLAAARRIAEPDPDSWHREWLRTADELCRRGEECLQAGHQASAREALLRASSYYHMSRLLLMGSPVDPRVRHAYEQHASAFRRAAALFSPACAPVAIPYEGTMLHGYFFQPDDGSVPRPTLIINGGYDGTAEEMYFFSGAAALQRGYNCLCFDGPGQGEALIRQGLVFRPDWEGVISPMVDYLVSRPEVDARRIALMGISFGGYLAPRAASGESRIAACIADPGEYDLFAAAKSRMPPFLARQLPRGNALAIVLLHRILDRVARHPVKGWSLRRGMWTHGADSPMDYLRATQDYTLAGRGDKITCPTLVCFAEDDDIAGQARQMYDALQCPRHFLSFTRAEGAGEHCESGNRALFNQRAFDWLDQTLR